MGTLLIAYFIGAAAEHVKGPGGQVLGALNTVMDIV